MELISKEALIAKIKPWIDDDAPVLNGYGVIETIEDFPTVESRPKGEWVETDLDCGRRHIRCNQCWYADCEIPKEKIKDMDYCPQCGAEMEKE